MGSYGTFTQNDASATSRPIKTYVETTGSAQAQVVRSHKATAVTHNSWTIVTTASTSQIPADTTRVGATMVNIGGARVYLRFDATAPTAAVYHHYLDAGDRYEVPEWATELAVSMFCATAGGTVVSALGTAA